MISLIYLAGSIGSRPCIWRAAPHCQVELHPNDKEKTVFFFIHLLWLFTVNPSGFCSVPATFNCWWRLSYEAVRTNPVWRIWIMFFLGRHSRNSLNISWQCFRGSAELTSHLTQRSVSCSRGNCSYNGESAKKIWPLTKRSQMQCRIDRCRKTCT
jgi:hypothetical protein